jgi:hypothetical protein
MTLGGKGLRRYEEAYITADGLEVILNIACIVPDLYSRAFIRMK